MSKNAADIAAPIGAVYGAEAGETFEQAWFNHITDVFNYARGVADDDAAVKSEARRQLGDYVTDLGEYLAEAIVKGATGEVLPSDDTVDKGLDVTAQAFAEELQCKFDHAPAALAADQGSN